MKLVTLPSSKYLLIILIVSIIGLLYFINIDNNTITDDEGTLLYQVWRVSLGEIPYQDFLTSFWPLFLYTGGLWMKAFGPDFIPMRVLSCILMLGTGVLVYIIAHEYVTSYFAALCSIIFLLHPQILRYGRVFQSESFYIFIGVLGFLFFIKGYKNKKSLMIILSSVLLAVATLYKPLGIFFWMGGILCLFIHTIRTHAKKISNYIHLFLYVFSYIFTVGTFLFILSLQIPVIWQCLFGLQFANLTNSDIFQVIRNKLVVYLDYFVLYFVLIIVALSIYLQKNVKYTELITQLIPIFGFLLLRRDIYTRYFIYVIPTLAILSGISLDRFCQTPYPRYLHIMMFLMIIFPWIGHLRAILYTHEIDTHQIVNIVQEYVPVSDRVLSDYQEINFLSKRATTYLGAEISNAFTKGNVIKASDLIVEIQDDNVKMVLIDINGDHMHSLGDYQRFQDYLNENFSLIGTYPREWQVIQIFYRE